VILVETDVSGEWDSSTDWPGLAADAVRAAVGASRERGLIDAGLAIEVSVKLTHDAEVKALNAGYRGKDSATNVLSFPMFEADLLPSLASVDGGELLLGDVVLAHGVCAREAEAKGVSLADHAAHLVVHGTLHLLGYDHEAGESEAVAMEEVEREALAALGVADPYEVHPG
jgi:probable rRNA maturation factor